MSDDRADKLLRKSFVEIQQLRAALHDAKAASSEPIAILGMACRAPGGIVDPDGYWALLAQGDEAIRPFPARFHPESVYDADPDAPGKSYVREGGFLDDVDRFDAPFFGIAAREATQMDPQQRVLLETSWEALERAGIAPGLLNASRTGVYMGAMGTDYGAEEFALERLDGYRTTGVIGSVLSGRISYLLGLHGPSMTIDTACSSSLVALHLACAALRQGECDLALGGGVTVMCTPSLFVEFSRLRASAPDGRCKAFSARADGAGWSEGCGVIVLKRLSDAQRAGDPVLAVIRGTAVNQDGRSQGLTAPNGPSQVRLLRRALEVSRLTPRDIDAIEAHGTGTSLGDPIEAGALGEVFGPSRREQEPVWLGSSKSNIGHAQAAAGVLGVIKMVLALAHERLPKTLHADQPSSLVSWQDSGLALLQDAQAWPHSEQRVRRAGVSSFGISGTNAHLIVEEAPRTHGEAAPEPHVAIPLLISGRDEAALRAQAGQWARWLALHPQQPMASVLCTAALQRTHFDVRASLAVSELKDAVDALRALSLGKPHAALTLTQARERKGIVFVFPGHGSQWPAMGRRLLVESRTFAEAIFACDRALRPHTGWSLSEQLASAQSEALARVDVLQPVLFAMGIGLAAVWSNLGIKPTAVLGHSVGELSAAVVSGALTLSDAARVVALRGRAIAAVQREGAMLHVQRPRAEVVARIAPWSDSLTVAVVNDGESAVVSGDSESISSLERILVEEGVFCRRVKIGFAAHSQHMDAVLAPFRADIAELRPQTPSIPFYSTVLGRRADAVSLDADYWCRNVRDVVRFDLAVQALLNDGHDVFVEAGAHPVLGIALNNACAEHDGVVVASLVRDEGSMTAIYRNLGLLHAAGVAVSWEAVLGGVRASLAPLPTYAFQRKAYWLAPRTHPRETKPDASPSDTAPPFVPTSVEAAETQSPLLHARLLLLPESQRVAAVLRVVCEEVAAVLGFDNASEVERDEPLRDMGFDSILSVQLRDRLSTQVGSVLPATLAFNHPTPAAIAAFITGKYAFPRAAEEAHWEDSAIQAKLRRISLAALKQSGLLEALMAQPDAPQTNESEAIDPDVLSLLSAEDESLLEVAARMLAESVP
jgi:acyl transferase domain-containing protein